MTDYFELGAHEPASSKTFKKSKTSANILSAAYLPNGYRHQQKLLELQFPRTPKKSASKHNQGEQFSGASSPFQLKKSYSINQPASQNQPNLISIYHNKEALTQREANPGPEEKLFIKIYNQPRGTALTEANSVSPKKYQAGEQLPSQEQII